jgi:tetratricopeptide (TPR) repeat protein
VIVSKRSFPPRPAASQSANDWEAAGGTVNRGQEMSTRRVNLLLIFTGLFIAASYVVGAVNNRSPEVGGLLGDLFDRLAGAEGYSLASEMMTPDEQITFWSARVKPGGTDYINLTHLGQAYLLQARESGDAASYARAAEALRQALEYSPSYQPAQAYLSTVLISLHRFQDALALAQQTYAADPDEMQALAIIGDANLELGDYAAAELAYQELLDRAGGAPAYSRLSRLAWIQGDPDAAIEWMRQAAESAEDLGVWGEQLAWYSFQLGELHFNTGDIRNARRWYQKAEDIFTNYYLAQAGLAKVAAAEGELDQAIELYEALVARRPQPEYLAALGDLYAIQDNTAAAQEQYDTVLFIGQLEETQQVLYSRQVALFLANHHIQPVKALDYAQRELEARQDVYAYDTLAWTLYQNGRLDEAAAMIEQALAEGTQDALLFYHAGMINAARGRAGDACAYLQKALDMNPYFDPLQAQKAKATLEELGN